jgi:hypothetical protein
VLGTMEKSMDPPHPPVMYWTRPVTCICLCSAFPQYFGGSSDRITLYIFERKKSLMTASVSMLLKSRASPDMLPSVYVAKKRLVIWHTNRLLFPTTLPIPSYDIGKYFGLRTYQNSLICYILFYIQQDGDVSLENYIY